MLLKLFVLLCSFVITDHKHFNGGTINWAPIDAYANSSTISIAITQTYSWTYPYISCANNVPISTSGWSSANRNLTCVVDCSSDGGYSTHPVNILTDCTSASASLGMLSSTRTNNITLNADAHFYIAYLGSAWVGVNYPVQSGLEWSIVTFIDLRMRPDGFINTPPVASVVSPQYVFVNQTIQINIPVSDANAGDDVRCRWASYTSGYRRRKRSNEQDQTNKDIHVRKLRSSGCQCQNGDDCTDSDCRGTICTSSQCNYQCCDNVTTTTISSTTTIQLTTTTTTATTTETMGTLKSTSSYPSRQAINECGGICYPGSLPNGTTLSNCTITFKATRAGVWYAAAVQVNLCQFLFIYSLLL